MNEISLYNEVPALPQKIISSFIIFISEGNNILTVSIGNFNLFLLIMLKSLSYSVSKIELFGYPRKVGQLSDTFKSV